MVAGLQGLTEHEAIARRARGEGNNVALRTGRSYIDIIRQNVLTFVNIILFTIGGALLLLGRLSDAVLSVGLIMLNIIIGVYQEARAKRQLDKIALLARPKATIIREGKTREVDPAEIVRGDLILIRAGDQIVVDGEIVGEGRIEVDESLLTGESDLIPKQRGDKVLSGSFCVTGSAPMEAQKVGAESFANQLTASARAYRKVKTPLQRDVEFAIRLLLILATFIGFLLLISAILYQIPLLRSVQMAAVTAGLIPNGLIFMVIIAYALGALRIAGRGALIQQMNSVESLSNVSVLCMDKTGTLTANRINFREAQPFGIDGARLQQLLGDFAASATASNRTNDAISAAFGSLARQGLKKTDEVPFSSVRKWSAIAFDDAEADPPMRGVYALGALEMLQTHLAPGTFPPDLPERVRALSDQGLRVLLFAHQPDVTALHGADSEPRLPDGLIALGLLSFTDELRAEAQQALAGFKQAGISLKIISGDSPHTVAALARQAGFEGELKVISGPELDGLDDSAFEKAALEATVFGRITPQQKERLVGALRARGAYVAMIGDGVNDVLSLKKAHLGIAMQSGSAATRGVADIVLLNDSFAALPPAFLEGQRILSGMRDILCLFLTRAAFVALLILSTAVVGAGFPFVPAHVSLLTLLMVGIPTFALAAWARPDKVKERLLWSISRFVFPAAATVSLFGLLIYLYFFVTVYTQIVNLRIEPTQVNEFAQVETNEYSAPEPDDEAFDQAGLVARTALTTFTVLSGLLLVVFVEPPIRFFVGGDELSPDKRPTILAGLLLLAFIAIKLFDPTLRFFEMIRLPLSDYAIIVGVVLVWMLTLRYIWRARLFERFLRVE